MHVPILQLKPGAQLKEQDCPSVGPRWQTEAGDATPLGKQISSPRQPSIE